MQDWTSRWRTGRRTNIFCTLTQYRACDALVCQAVTPRTLPEPAACTILPGDGDCARLVECVGHAPHPYHAFRWSTADCRCTRFFGDARTRTMPLTTHAPRFFDHVQPQKYDTWHILETTKWAFVGSSLKLVSRAPCTGLNGAWDTFLQAARKSNVRAAEVCSRHQTSGT